MITTHQAQLWAQGDKAETHVLNAQGPQTFPLLGFQNVQNHTYTVQVETRYSSLGTLSSQRKMANKMAQQDHPGLMPRVASSTHNYKATQQLSIHAYTGTDGQG